MNLKGPVNMLSPEIASAADDFIKDIHAGTIRGNQVHIGTMQATASHLVNAIMGNFKQETAFNSPQWGMVDFLHNNIFAFSAAKSLTEFEAFGQMLTDEDGNIRSFKDFRDQVDKLNLRYNELYLQAEYESAIAQGQNADRWNEIEQNREAGGEVEYRTAHDDRVRDSHRRLDGMIFSIDDPILDTIAPQNDWGCRCLLVQVDKPHNHTPKTEAVAAAKDAKIPPYFKNNPGRTGMVYDDGHPYFKNVPLDKLQQLSAVKNYGMKTPEQIYMRPDKLAKRNDPFENVNQFKAWWGSKTIAQGDKNKSFAILSKPLNNLPVTFDEELYNRFLKGKYAKEARFELMPNIESILSDPDEIWSVYIGKSRGSKTELLTGYIKYFEDKPILVVTRTKRNKGFGYVRMTSIYEVDSKSLENWRKGILRYKKS